MHGIYIYIWLILYGFHVGKYTHLSHGSVVPWCRNPSQKLHLLGTLVELIKRGPNVCFFPHQSPFISSNHIFMQVFVFFLMKIYENTSGIIFFCTSLKLISVVFFFRCFIRSHRTLGIHDPIFIIFFKWVEKNHQLVINLFQLSN